MQVTIDYRFTSLNDYIDVERSNRYAAAEIKKRETEVSRLSALNKRPNFEYPVEIVCHWFRKDARTDPDNIEFGVKFILDGFVKAGFLKSDGWKYIRSISIPVPEIDCINHQIVNTDGHAVSVVEHSDHHLNIVDEYYNELYDGDNPQDAFHIVVEYLLR